MSTSVPLENFKKVIEHPRTPQLVANYFEAGSNYAGELFNSIPQDDPNVVTAADLLAVTLLSVQVSPPGVRRLLSAEFATEVRSHLQGIPDTMIWHDDAVEALASASHLWNALQAVPSVGPVIAGKLLARKRPGLIPIVDDIVRRVIRAEPGKYWEAYRAFLLIDEHRQHIEALRPATVSVEDVSTLRLLDVAIWMFGMNLPLEPK